VTVPEMILIIKVCFKVFALIKYINAGIKKKRKIIEEIYCSIGKKKFNNKLINDNIIDPYIPILQTSDTRFFLFLIKIFPQVIRYKVDIIEYKKT
jgi:hypothetical protein